MAEEEQNDSELDETEQLFSDYYEDSLDASARAKFDARIAEDASFAQAYKEFVHTMEMLSGMHKVSAPMHFDKKVEDTIHRRSGGRFFGRRAFGQRIPYEVLAIVVMLLAGAIYWMGRTSATGGHRLNKDKPPAQMETERDVVPRL